MRKKEREYKKFIKFCGKVNHTPLGKERERENQRERERERERERKSSIIFSRFFLNKWQSGNKD